MAAAVSIALPAVAAPAAETLEYLHRQDVRVEATGFRLAAANAGLCPGGSDAGFSVHTVEQYGPAWRTAAAEVFGLGAAPAVLAVAPGSPAEAAGLKEGDALIAAGGTALPASAKASARADFTRTAAVQRLLDAAFARGPATLSIRRGGTLLELLVTPARACPSLFQVIPDAGMNGEADGEYVQVSTELVALARNDDELAAVLAHELAHNILGHRARLDALHVDRGLFSMFGRNARLIRATERDADRLGVYLLARAGYDPGRAMAIWRRLHSSSPSFVPDPTHPRWSERLAVMQQELQRMAADPAAPPPGL